MKKRLGMFGVAAARGGDKDEDCARAGLEKAEFKPQMVHHRTDRRVSP
jgi:hypothetical protein